MMYDVFMKRTTVFLTDELDGMLQETSRRMHRSRAEIVREALEQYLEHRQRPWPRSIGMGSNKDQSVTSENVKDWVRERWRHEATVAEVQANERR